MDISRPLPEYRSESLRPVEYMNPPTYTSEMAGWVAFQERNSIATVLQTQIAEAQRHAMEWSDVDAQTFTAERFGSDTETYQAVWKKVLSGMKESDAIKHYRNVNGLVETKSEADGALRGFERAVYRAVQAVPMSEKQRNTFIENFSERDFSLAKMMVNVAEQYGRAQAAGIKFDEDGNAIDAAFSLSHPPEAHLFIAAPKLRPAEYMDVKEIRGLIRRFGDTKLAETAKMEMNRDLRGLEDITEQAA
jgi:hypothetical protein